MKPSVLSRLAVLLIATGTTVSSQTLQLEVVERLPTPVVDPASDDARLAIKRFALPAGLQAKLWAAEPMLANPVAVDFDEKGRLFVSETYRYKTSVLDIREYMGMLELDLAARTVEDRSKFMHSVFGEQVSQFAIESEIVRLVEDRDRDGVADTSSIFANGFNSELDGIASGVLARRGKVWFTNIPSLWLLEENASGAPKRSELLRGFGVHFNYTGHDFHGLALGHDGKIYYSIGDRGAHVKGKEGQVIEVPDEGAVFRSNPDGSEFELFARGLRNPQELVFDEHGNLFTGDNDSDQGDLERLVYLVEGGDSGWRIGYQHAPLGKGGPWMSENLWKPRFDGRPAYLLPPVCNIEDGPSGLAYYPGTGLSPEYAGHFFITHFKGSIARSGIQSYTLKPDGATFTPTSGQVFMGGVLATDVTFAPDGALYISDWVEGWPKSKKGRIYGITAVNQDAKLKQQSADLAALLAAGFEKKTPAELRALLAHPDRRARLEAQLELATRGAPSIKTFLAVANDRRSAPLARLHALWGLTQLGRDDARVGAWLTRLLTDADAEVRAQSAKGLGDVKYSRASAALAKALTDTSARVQFFAAQSLGKLAQPASTAPLLALLRANDNKDAYLRHAAAHALARIGNSPTLDAGAKDASGAVRLGVLLAYRELKDAALAGLVGDSDAFIAREAAMAINDAPVADAYPALAARLANAPATDQPLVLRAINAHYRLAGSDNARALADYAARESAAPAMRAEALTQLGLWEAAPQRDRVVGIYRPLGSRDGRIAADALARVAAGLLDNSPESVQLATIAAIGNLQPQGASAALVRTIANEKAGENVRVAALKALDGFKGDEMLRGVAAAETSATPALRLAALQIVARRAPDRALPIIRRFVSEGSVSEQRAAFEALGQLDSREAPQLLLGAMNQLAAGKVQPGAQAELLDAVEKSKAPLVQARWAKQQAEWSASKDALAPYRSTLTGGDPRRGYRQFSENAVLPCGRCHKVRGDGGEAGPDLTLIGKQKSAEYLLESIIKPNAHIAAGFDIVTLQLAGGETETGSVVSESASQIVLKRADNSQVTLDAKKVKQRQAAPSSMPEIYAQVLSRTELRDIMAMMVRLNSEGGSGPEEKFGTTNRAMSKVTEPAKTGGHE